MVEQASAGLQAVIVVAAPDGGEVAHLVFSGELLARAVATLTASAPGLLAPLEELFIAAEGVTSGEDIGQETRGPGADRKRWF